MSLCVLMSLQQQVDQSWNSTCLPEWRLIGRAERQISDETNCGLRHTTEIKEFFSAGLSKALCGSALKTHFYVVPPNGIASFYLEFQQAAYAAVMFTIQCVMLNIKANHWDERKEI